MLILGQQPSELPSQQPGQLHLFHPHRSVGLGFSGPHGHALQLFSFRVWVAILAYASPAHHVALRSVKSIPADAVQVLARLVKPLNLLQRNTQSLPSPPACRSSANVTTTGESCGRAATPKAAPVSGLGFVQLTTCPPADISNCHVGGPTESREQHRILHPDAPTRQVSSKCASQVQALAADKPRDSPSALICRVRVSQKTRAMSM